MSNFIGDIVIPEGVPGSNEGVASIIGRILDVAYAVAGIATMGLFIYAGITIITATGDPEKIKRGQDTLTNAVIGLVLVFVSGLIFQFIGRLLGVESLITWFDFNLS